MDLGFLEPNLRSKLIPFLEESLINLGNLGLLETVQVGNSDSSPFPYIFHNWDRA